MAGECKGFLRDIRKWRDPILAEKILMQEHMLSKKLMLASLKKGPKDKEEHTDHTDYAKQIAIIFDKDKCNYIFKDIKTILNSMAGKESDGQERI